MPPSRTILASISYRTTLLVFSLLWYTRLMHVPEDKTKRKMEFAGLPIDVQFDKGDRRHYPAANGYPEYNVTMQAIYGEVPRTKGTDGDPVDVYIGPNQKSTKVYVLRQMKFPKYLTFDEEKCMLGFDSEEEAKACYLKHHQNKKIFGGIKELSWEEFMERLTTKGREGKKLAAAAEIVFVLQNNGVKLSADQTAAIYQNRTTRGVLGIQPDTAAPPPATPFGEATVGAAKVALDLKKLMQHGAGITAHPVAQRALNAPSPEDGLLELANPVFSKVVDKAKRLVKKAADMPPIKASCGDELAYKMERAATDKKYAKRLEDLAQRRDPDGIERAKKASTVQGRVGRIAERVDDVGIGMLAAPYAARGLATLKNRGGRIGAVGQVADRAAKAMHHHEVPLELGGLALVAPGVTNRVAAGLDRVLPGRRPAPVTQVATPVVPSRPVSKVAADLPFKEKGIKRVGQLLTGSHAKELITAAVRKSKVKGGNAGKDVARLLNDATKERMAVQNTRIGTGGLAGSALVGGAAGVGADRHRKKSKEKSAALEKLAMELRPDFEYLPEPEKLAYLGALRSIAARAKPLVQQGVQSVRGAVQGAVNPGAAKTMVPGQTGVTGILSPGNVAKAGLLGAGAVGAVGAYKGVKGMANFLGAQHQHPVAPPQYEAPRVL
jgi:hypothetical protein